MALFMVDTVWMRDVLGALGPVRTPAWPEPITADNVLPVLAEEVSVDDDSNRIQGAIAAEVWTAFQHRDVSASAFATALAKSVKERHLQVYSTHPAEQATLRRLGATGETTLGKNPLAVVWQGIGANKLAWFVERRSMSTSSWTVAGPPLSPRLSRCATTRRKDHRVDSSALVKTSRWGPSPRT